jgi:hypothetical protein
MSIEEHRIRWKRMMNESPDVVTSKKKGKRLNLSQQKPELLKEPEEA